MAVNLEGQCRVTGVKEGRPLVYEGLSLRPLIGRATGAHAISLRVLEFASGRSPTLSPADCDDVLYVFEGSGRVFLDRSAVDVKPDTGIYLRPGAHFSVLNPGPEPLILISSQCPEPADEIKFTETKALASEPDSGLPPTVHLWERKAKPTSDRWYRVLVDEKMGSKQVTQFVGAIPPGRAPDHFHHYEEVLCILSGEGKMWAGESSTPIRRGSCVFLPRHQVHCVENTGSEELRLLGVFYPAGSPAARFDQDD